MTSHADIADRRRLEEIVIEKRRILEKNAFDAELKWEKSCEDHEHDNYCYDVDTGDLECDCRNY